MKNKHCEGQKDLEIHLAFSETFRQSIPKPIQIKENLLKFFRPTAKISKLF